MHIVRNTPEVRRNRPLRAHGCDLERHVLGKRDAERRARTNRIVSQRQHAH